LGAGPFELPGEVFTFGPSSGRRGFENGVFSALLPVFMPLGVKSSRLVQSSNSA
jgi:hypothetical protein